MEIWQLWLKAAQSHTDSNRHFRVAVTTAGRCRDKARQLRAELGLLASACGITTTAQEAVLGTIAEAVAEAESFAHVELATKLLPSTKSVSPLMSARLSCIQFSKNGNNLYADYHIAVRPVTVVPHVLVREGVKRND